MAEEKSINENNANRMSKNEYYLLIALAVSKKKHMSEKTLWGSNSKQ